MTKLNTIAPVLFLVMWSSGAVIVKLGLQFSSQWSFLALRALISLLCISVIFLIARRFSKARFSKPTQSDIASILMVGLLLQVLYLTFYILAIDSGMSPGLVTLVLGIQPLITPLLCQQKIDRIKVLLLVLGFSGLCIAIAGAQTLTEIGLSGLLSAVLALLALTFGTIKQKKVTIQPVQAMWYQCLLSSTIFTLVSLYVGWEINWTGELVFSALWMSIVVSVGALLLLMYMVNKESSDKVSVLFYAVPVLTYLFDHLLFGTTLSSTTLFGMALVAFSILIYRRQTSTNHDYESSSVIGQNSR